MNVSEVMTHGVYTTSPDETVQTAAQTMADLDTGPVEIAGEALSGIASSEGAGRRFTAGPQAPAVGTRARD